MKKTKKHLLFSHFMSPELWLFFLHGDVCMFFVSEMVIPIGGCIASTHKAFIHRRCCTRACIESLSFRFLSRSGRVRFNSLIRFSIPISVSVSMCAFEFVVVVVVVVVDAGVVVFLLKFCLHPFSSHASDAFLLAYKNPYGFDLPLSIFFSCFNLRYQHYIIFPFCQHTLGVPCTWFMPFFLLLYLEFGALHSSSMPRYEAIHSFSGSFFFVFSPPKSFFQVYYHSIVNVMYTWVVSSRCWCTFFYSPVCVCVYALYIERECIANVM